MNYRALLRDLRRSKKQVLVAGLGISGIEATISLGRMGLSALATEALSESDYRSRGKYLSDLARLEDTGATVQFGYTVETLQIHLAQIGLAVLSPGLSFQSEFVQCLMEAGIPVTNELELAVELYNRRSIFVTGTNGKSTTSTLIAEILNAAGWKTLLCGNVGRPAIAELPDDLLDLEKLPERDLRSVLVVEISSYQIESSSRATPDIGVFLNLSENHLERHGTLENYFAIKSTLFRRQKQNQWFVYNRDDDRVCSLSAEVASRGCSFGSSSHPEGECSALVRYARSSEAARGIDKIEIRSKQGVFEIPLHDAMLIGQHNRMNMAAAALVAEILQIPHDLVCATLTNFCGLEHRMERLVGPQGSVIFNDSKSTTPLACEVALAAVCEAYPDFELVLCVGGKLKRGGDLHREWLPVVKLLGEHRRQCREIICFGSDGLDLQQIFGESAIDASWYRSVREMMPSLIPSLSERTVLLFSPGCASFDEFRDFEHRGRVFKELLA